MISTHVLDVALGTPARALTVRLEVLAAGGTWQTLAAGVTDDDGRVPSLGEAPHLAGRTCRLSFETRVYFESSGRPVFFPFIDVVFCVDAGRDRYHVPLLLSPFGYSTYRGS